MFLEYDWTFNVYRVRFGNTFIAFRGWFSFENLDHARYELGSAGCKLGRKTASRSWKIELKA